VWGGAGFIVIIAYILLRLLLALASGPKERAPRDRFGSGDGAGPGQAIQFSQGGGSLPKLGSFDGPETERKNFSRVACPLCRRFVEL
jgi:hypothetical protein